METGYSLFKQELYHLERVRSLSGWLSLALNLHSRRKYGDVNDRHYKQACVAITCHASESIHPANIS